MGRPEKPVDPEAGPVQRLAWQLRQLRERAGNPSYRRLAKRAHYSASTLAEAAKGDRLPSLEVTLAYVEACGGDRAEWRARWSAAEHAAAQATEAGDDQAEERCPYQGLAAFEPEQSDWFFGRSHLVERLLGRVTRLPLVALLGASGSGKSSLLRAGLLGTIAADPALAERWRSVLITPTEHPAGALAEGLAKLTGSDIEQVRAALADDATTLDVTVRTMLAAGPAETRLLMVVDQFEELFALCTDETERGRFIDALLDAAQQPDGRTSAVIGVRADFLGHVTQYPRLVEALDDDAQLLVGPVSAADLREIIIRPAAQAGLGVEPDLVSTVLADAADQPGALPLVSHALMETWHRRDRPTLTLAAYQASGGVRGALAQTAERVYADLDHDRRAVARQVFTRLTALGDGTEDTRRPIARAELHGIADPDITADVVHRLADARLVILGDGTVDVAHEALIRAWPRLHRWLTDDRASLVLHRRLTEAARVWQSLDRDSGALFRGAQLYGVTVWAEEHPRELNQLEQGFLRASQVQADAEQDSARRRARLLNRLVAAVSTLLILALLGGAAAVDQRQDARRQERDVLAKELSLRARNLIATDPDLAGLLAVEADRLSPSDETRSGVLSAAAAARPIRLNVGGQPVPSIEFSPDHTRLAAASTDGSIDLWDPTSGVALGELAGQAGPGLRVAFNGDGSRLASTARDGSIFVWDVRTRQPIIQRSEAGITIALAFSADGDKLAVGVGRGRIAVHDLKTGSRRVLHRWNRAVTSLSFSPDARVLASADGLNRPVAWNVGTGAVLADLPAEHVFSLAFGRSENVLAAAADEKGLHLWDFSGPRPVPLPALPLRGAYAWTASAPVGSQIAIADENGAVTIWDFRRRLRQRTFHDRGRTETRAVVLSPDGAMLASAGFNGTIVAHDLRNEPFGGFDAPVQDIKVSPDGSGVAVASSDGTVRLWDTAGRLQRVLDGHPDKVQALSFGANGRLLAALTRNISITIWDLRMKRRAAGPLPGPGIGASTDIAFAPDGRLLATATLGTYVWDVADPAAPADISSRYQSQFSTSLAFTPDGRRLVSASVAGHLTTWDAATGKVLSRHNTGQGAIQDVAISPDGTLIATAGDGRTIKLWNASTMAEVAEFSGHTAPIQVLAFSDDGRTLASAGDDHTVAVWDVPTRTRLAALSGHQARIRGLAFLPDGTLISGDEEGRILRWITDLPTATHRLCGTIGRTLTRQEWSNHIPSRRYEPTCGTT